MLDSHGGKKFFITCYETFQITMLWGIFYILILKINTAISVTYIFAFYLDH